MGTLAVDKLLKTSTGAAEFTLPATDGTVGQAWISDGSGQLSVGEVTAAGIAASAVTATELADNAVVTNKVSDGALTAAKLVANSITPAQMADSAYLANRNMLINGAMQISQRATSATGKTTGGYYTVDRFQNQFGNLGTWTVTQEADGPAGFASSWKIDCTTADATPAAGDYVFASYGFEGFDCQSWKKGTASAVSLTLSFWVKSYQTGIWQVNLRDYNNNRLVGGTYTVSASATWEYKTITFAPDTTGAITNNASANVAMEMWMGSGTDYSSGAVPTAWETRANTDRNAGSTIQLGDSTNNYWQITGVQLEIGTTATPFEHKSYGQELQACERYYQTYGMGFHAFGISSSVIDSQFSFRTMMRASPSVTLLDTTPTFQQINVANRVGVSSSITTSAQGPDGTGMVRIDGFSSVGSNSVCMGNQTTPIMGFSAEI